MSEDSQHLNVNDIRDLISNIPKMSNKDVFEASRDGDLIALEGLLEEHPDQVNALNDRGETPLHWASMSNRVDVIEYLIQHGANIAAQENVFRSTPLHWAVWCKSARSIGVLIRNGAPMDIMDTYGYTPLILCAHTSDVYSAIVLTSNGTFVDAQDHSGRTALSWAISTKSAEVAIELIRSGADVTLRDAEGKSPLHYCILSSCRPQIFVSLINAGADLGDIDTIRQQNPVEFKSRRKLIKQYMSHMNIDGAKRSRRKRTITRILYVAHLLELFACIYLPLAYIPLLYGITTALAFSAIVSVSILLVPKISASRIEDLSPIVLIHSGAFIASSTIVIAEDTCCNYPAVLYALFVSEIAAIIAYIIVVRTEPGVITKTPVGERKQIVNTLNEAGLITRKSFCYTCYIQRPDISWHCSKCDVCIRRFDHHCAWINGCVGEGNYRYFVILITLIFTSLMLYAYTSIEYVYTRPEELGLRSNYTVLDYFGGHKYLYSVVVLAVTGVQAVWLLPLILLHIYLTAAGKTSAECIKERVHARHHRNTKGSPKDMRNARSSYDGFPPH